MTTSVLTLAMGFGIWAGVHSLLASLPVKNLFRRRFGPGADRWYRIAYNAFAGLTVLPVIALAYFLPDRLLYVVPAPWSWVMRIGQALAGLAIVGTVVQSGAAGFLGLSQLLGREPLEGGTLTVTGLYCHSRHPLYFFSLVVLSLMPVMSVNRLVGILLVMIYLALGSIHEERRLLAQFGEAYASYRREVPWMIPRPGRCVPPTGVRQSSIQ